MEQHSFRAKEILSIAYCISTFASKAKPITYLLSGRCVRLAPRGHLACNYHWFKILAQDSISSDPDVYFSSKSICEHYFQSFHKLLNKMATTKHSYFMLRTILLQWFVFISPRACSSCWIRCRRVEGSVCNTWAV